MATVEVLRGMKSASLWFLALALIQLSGATILQKTCDDETLDPPIAEVTLGDMGIELLVGEKAPGSNLTMSSLYPLHLKGGFEEAIIKVVGESDDPADTLSINLEPGHQGVACVARNRDNLKMIHLNEKPTSAYIKLLSTGMVDFEVWVLRDDRMGYGKISFVVEESKPPTTDADRPILLAATNSSNPDSYIESPVEIQTLSITSPSSNTTEQHSHSQPIQTKPSFPPSLDSVVLPSEGTVAHTGIAKDEISIPPSPVEIPSPSAAPLMPWTFAPTRTHMPTTTFSPSYSTPCHICGSPDKVIVNADQSVPILDLSVSCAMLQQWSRSGFLSPSTCAEAQEPVKNVCGCQEEAASAQPSPIRTFPPTSSTYPTITASPTYSEKCSFDVCENVGADASVPILGLAVSCKSLLQNAEKNFVSPQVCEVSKDAVKRHCSCSRPSPFPSLRAPTAAPEATTPAITITAAPAASPTVSPTFLEDCEICAGEIGATLVVAGEEYLCDEFRSFGVSGLISPDVCPTVQALAMESCGCEDMATGSEEEGPNEAVSTPSPAAVLAAQGENENENQSREESSRTPKRIAITVFVGIATASALL